MWSITNTDTGKTRKGFDSCEDAEEFILSFYGTKGVITSYNEIKQEILYYLEKKAC